MGEMARKLNDAGLSLADSPITAVSLAGLIDLIERRVINSSTAKEVFEKMWTAAPRATAIVEADGLAQISDEGRAGRRRESGAGRTSRAGTAVPRWTNEGARLPRRTGDESHRRQGESRAGQRADAARARRRVRGRSLATGALAKSVC